MAKPNIDNMYGIIGVDKKYNRTKFWRKHAKYKYDENYKNYLIYDNGNRPFSVYVHVDNRIVHIYTHGDDYAADAKSEVIEEHIKSLNDVTKVFIGKSYLYSYEVCELGRLMSPTIVRNDNGDPVFSDVGNSILLQLDDCYLFIGWDIYTFKTDEKITNYYSVVGNNNVPYPVAIGEHNAYMMLDKVYIDKKYFPPDVDWMYTYQDFYTEKHNNNKMPDTKFKHHHMIKNRM